MRRRPACGCAASAASGKAATAPRRPGRDLARLRQLAERSGLQLRVLRRTGPGRLAERLWQRPGVWVGALLVCGAGAVSLRLCLDHRFRRAGCRPGRAGAADFGRGRHPGRHPRLGGAAADRPAAAGRPAGAVRLGGIELCRRLPVCGDHRHGAAVDPHRNAGDRPVRQRQRPGAGRPGGKRLCPGGARAVCGKRPAAGQRPAGRPRRRPGIPVCLRKRDRPRSADLHRPAAAAPDRQHPDRAQRHAAAPCTCRGPLCRWRSPRPPLPRPTGARAGSPLRWGSWPCPAACTSGGRWSAPTGS